MPDVQDLKNFIKNLRISLDFYFIHYWVSRVDILQGDRVCINMACNQVRLILKVEYGYGMAFVRWIGWHKDYDALGNRIHKI